MQLRQFTTLRVGGTPLRHFHPGDADGLRQSLRECRRGGLAWRVLGGGSNLLVDEGSLPFAVIHVHSPGFDGVERTRPTAVRAGAGLPTSRLLASCREAGLGGLEFLAGLPGTVGGAVAGNAGAWGQQTCGPMSRLWLMDADGELQQHDRSRIRASYRSTDLGGAVVVAAEFELVPRSPELVALQMAEHARARAARHPMGQASAGCVFKNPAGQSAGRLLDLCGLKGLRVGGAEVSSVHANFVLNRGDATASDVLRLLALMKSAVRRRFGVELELEVRHWSARSKVA